MKGFVFVLLFLTVKSSFSQTDDYNKRIKVLEKDSIGKEYIFGKWTQKKGEELHLKYLGKTSTSSDRIIKIMTSEWIWGEHGRRTCRLVIFNNENQYIGNYYIDYGDLTVELKNGYLIFTNKKQTHRVNINNSIPKLLQGLQDAYLFE
jgi:hypothetical protein